MTRINATIPVNRLTDEHLLAEHREIKRLPACLAKATKTGSINHIPDKFCLGRGHVTFFLDKMLYLLDRYHDIHDECLRRGFNVIDYSSNWSQVDSRYMNRYQPDVSVHNVVVDRIVDRLEKSPKTTWHYNGRKITKHDAMKLLDK